MAGVDPPRSRRATRRIAACAAALIVMPVSAHAVGVPHLAHVVVVVMENKSYDEVRTQPFVTSLASLGATMTRSYAVTHPSEPNYLALWAGSPLGVTDDACPPAGAPFAAPNLGQACEAAGRTWRAYAENLPAPAFTGCSYDGDASTGLYTRKHAPWTAFSNLDHSNERPYSDLALDLAASTLPNLCFIVPNNCHNTHDSGTPGCAIADGDAWLSTNLPAILTGITPDGILILTWDEDDSAGDNHVLTLVVGSPVTPNYLSPTAITHATVVRLVCDVLGIPPLPAVAVEAPLLDIWQLPLAAPAGSWGRVKALYR